MSDKYLIGKILQAQGAKKAKERKHKNQCGDCEHYNACNEKLGGKLDKNETFPEFRNGCKSFKKKDRREKWKNALLALILMALFALVMIIVSARVNAIYGTKFDEKKGDEIILRDSKTDEWNGETEEKMPISDCGEEKTLIYTKREAELIAKTLWGECRGVKSKMEQAAVAWCILNRVDDPRFGNTIEDVITAPYQFAGYRESNPVSTSLLELAKDVLERWLMEKNDVPDVGRVLPKEYCYFCGYDGRNYFFYKYKNPHYELLYGYWAFNCDDPYEERE